MQIETNQPPRLLTPTELGMMVKMLREARRWSQEQLAAISGLSGRSIQRVESGKPSSLDTRRALARALDADDIDVFEKEVSLPAAEEV